MNNKNNLLQHETSPYLLQHAENPVNWYPWGEEAFDKAREEDKPIFLSIGYSTCHWCHVMAHESFEDEKIAEILNGYFVSIKVDKEERPDIDNIYMSVCQAFTGSGGWPTSIFMTPEQKPFFAGTYFPNRTKNGMIGMPELLLYIADKWKNDRNALLHQAESIIAHLKRADKAVPVATEQIMEDAVVLFQRTFDRINGGFGTAPKFPTPHNLIFLLEYYRKNGKEACLNMANHTLLQTYVASGQKDNYFLEQPDDSCAV